ncbi:MAG: NfeD-like C-terminal, partner-binding [Gammaproteobacteria bacterium]|nr:NfeD-like C-terminal, partner-binding [Gammaproteobacteria bacterium]
MSRDNLYLLLGVVIFITAFIVLALTTELSFTVKFGIAILITIASDILIVIDNEHRNAAPDAKLHHRNELVGETAHVQEGFQPAASGLYSGKIEIHGEHWQASSFEPDLRSGDQVRIIDRTGMTFMVKKC